MNTIIYIYPGRNNASFKIEKLDETDYCLIRLGLPVPLWKHIKQMDKEIQDKPESVTEENVSEGIWVEGSLPITNLRKRRISKKICFTPRKGIIPRRKANSIWKRGRDSGGNVAEETPEKVGNNLRDEEPREAQKQEVLRKEAIRQQITELLQELESLQTALCLLGGNTYWTYTVYEERLRCKIDTPSWWELWKIPEFENYSQPLWAEKIIFHGNCPNFLILGQSDCIPGMLVAGVRRMRSIKWYLLQREYTGETEAFIDNFYEEYGLVIEIHFLEEKKDWWRVGFHCPDPVKVLDFTGEAKVSSNGVPKGSVWLDMSALDEKSRRMEVRNQGIQYFSLKKLWGQLQKGVNTLTPM